jgi:hypothetical protein
MQGTTFCSIHQCCHGLHDPFVCRIVPAALLWMSKKKQADDKFYIPAGLVDVLLTQALRDGEEFEQAGFFPEYCEFIAFHSDQYFSALYYDQAHDFTPLRQFITLMSAPDQLPRSFFVRDLTNAS